MTISTGALGADFSALVTRLQVDAATVAAMAAAGAWSHVPLAAAPDLTVALFAARDLLASTASSGVAMVHASGALPAGQVSTKRWLEVATGMSARSAGAQLARAGALAERFPRTRLAWLAGQLSDDMVRTITLGIPAALRRLSVAETAQVITALEAHLVPFATTASITDVQHKLAKLTIVLDPDGTNERALDAYDAQQLTLTPVGDGYEVRGYLTAESAAVLLTVLDRTVDSWFRDGSLTAEQQVVAGDDAMSHGRRRMRRAHLNALALAELCEQLLDTAALGTEHAQRPHVLVTVDAEEYRAGLGGDLHLPGVGPEPITAEAVDQVLCDADVTLVLSRPTAPRPEPGDAVRDARSSETVVAGRPVADWLHDPAREVLYVGRSRRTAPPRLRKALTIRDGHCQFPDCRVTAERCHAHHVREWTRDGGTDLDNMLLVCQAHHTTIHKQKWTVTRVPGTRPGQPGCWRIDPPPRRRTP